METVRYCTVSTADWAFVPIANPWSIVIASRATHVESVMPKCMITTLSCIGDIYQVICKSWLPILACAILGVVIYLESFGWNVFLSSYHMTISSIYDCIGGIEGHVLRHLYWHRIIY